MTVKNNNNKKLTCFKLQNSKIQLEDSEREPNVKKNLNSIRKFKFSECAHKALKFDHIENIINHKINATVINSKNATSEFIYYEVQKNKEYTTLKFLTYS